MGCSTSILSITVINVVFPMESSNFRVAPTLQTNASGSKTTPRVVVPSLTMSLTTVNSSGTVSSALPVRKEKVAATLGNHVA